MDYPRLQDRSLRMIDKYGIDMVIEVATLSSFNPATDSYTMATAGYEAKGVFTSIIRKDDSGFLAKIRNGAILFPAKDLPALDDQTKLKILYDDKVYQPTKIEPIQPGGTPVIFKIWIV